MPLWRNIAHFLELYGAAHKAKKDLQNVTPRKSGMGYKDKSSSAEVSFLFHFGEISAHH